MSVANTFGTPNNSVGTLNGFFKERYANELKNLIPDNVKLMKMVDFVSKDRQGGNLYHAPVILNMEHGVTYGSSDEDFFNLNSPVAGGTKDAQVKGSPVMLRSVLGYTAASRAAINGAAFMDATKFLVANMLRSMSKRLEISMLYGADGLATVASVSGADITITTAEWAPGIWAGAERMPIEIRDSSSIAFPASGSSRGEGVVRSVNMDTRVITLEAAIPGVVAGDVIWAKGAYGNEFIGVRRILRQSSGTLFNIDTATYSLFRGNVYGAGSTDLSLTKLNLALARAVEKGLDEKVVCLINPRTWAHLLSDQASLRMYDSSYSRQQLENGSQALKFFSQNGEIQIEPSIYVKEGDAFLLAINDWERVGSSDLSFRLPGQGEDFFLHRPDSTGLELRLWSDQAIFCRAPGRSVYINAIVNST